MPEPATPEQADRQREACRQAMRLVEHFRRDLPFRAPEVLPEHEARLLNELWQTLLEVHPAPATLTPPVALLQRPDLLEQQARLVRESRRNWRGRLADLGDYGTTGGSAADARSIVEWMAALEAAR